MSALAAAHETLEAELREARKTLVETIGDSLLDFDAASRRFLLAVKRNCFNGRAIAPWRDKAEWAGLARLAPRRADRIAVLEAELAASDRALEALYEQELSRERRHVLSLTEDRRFLRGVALGRPGLVEKIRAEAPALAAAAVLKRPAKWEHSLLRFVTRAAVKLSANSTLTAYALGSVDGSPAATGFRFLGAPQRETSLVRADRPELEQFQSLLFRHPAVRERCLVALNDSLEEIEPGRYRFVRDGHWQLGPGAEGFQLVPPARITIRPENALLGPAADALREGPLVYGTLRALLQEGAGLDAGEAQRLPRSARSARSAPPAQAAELDRLIDLGLLLLLPPWPTWEPRLEERIAQFLAALPPEPGLGATLDALAELLALERGFAAAPRPEGSVAALTRAFARLLDTVVPLSGQERPLPAGTPRVHFFEEVLLAPGESSGDERGLFQIAASTVEEIQSAAGLALRFAALFNHRHDVLHTLAAWWREHAPRRREIPFTEVARGFAPLFKEYLHFHKAAGDSGTETFDPLETAALAVLNERREALLTRYWEALNTTPAKDALAPHQLAELLAPLPRRYAPLLGTSVFVQPVDAAGSSWVLNRLGEGTGRYLSRVTPVLEGPRQQAFLDHLIARSAIELEGEEAELLEVEYPWGHLVKAHPPQAARVLDVRGAHSGLPAERRAGLGELTVQADLDAETFRLLDARGRRLLPVNLSTLPDAGHPNLLRLLLAFGPGENRTVFPFAFSAGDEDFRSWNRFTCGRLVVRRRSFRIGIGSLTGELALLDGPRAFSALDAWRRRLGLPAVGFYYEQTHRGTFKPQYVDFRSPSLCCLFLASLRKAKTSHFLLEEALPRPADFPFDAANERRGIELLIDSLAMGTVRGTFFRSDTEP